jgi:hypothetical protein
MNAQLAANRTTQVDGKIEKISTMRPSTYYPWHYQSGNFNVFNSPGQPGFKLNLRSIIISIFRPSIFIFSIFRPSMFLFSIFHPSIFIFSIFFYILTPSQAKFKILEQIKLLNISLNIDD